MKDFEILPASLLRQKDKWRAISASLPQGSALIILPKQQGPAWDTLLGVAQTIESTGQEVTLMLEQDAMAAYAPNAPQLPKPPSTPP